ncbi:SMI1/KNR4 family protein [Streptomyces sp. NPDC004787]|uniref:SMI1/KNR4 family protein n=1 Tax=Streptomyces sp. NPDC004787 TaxID=3154291 RepID=UPI0033B62BEF
MDLLIPSSFRELHRSGRFDYWGSFRHSLSDAERTRLYTARQTEVLWWDGIEWSYSPDDVMAFSGNNRLTPGLYPFASTGDGDLYCWYPRWQERKEPPVVLYSDDNPRSVLFACDFSEFLCRGILRAYSLRDTSARVAGEPETREVWRCHNEIIRPFLEPAHQRIIAAIGPDPAPASCANADRAIADRLPSRHLMGAQQPTQYNDEAIPDTHTLLRLYDQSVAYYRDLVIDQGMEEFRSKLHEAEAARTRARRNAG